MISHALSQVILNTPPSMVGTQLRFFRKPRFGGSAGG